ncbi:unnamed protein product [Rotaria socialis]|uniref:Cation efflux protein cytoplasmic domain-containing protein n=4 Tax=Rotaria socialis TaxID=392032 RepID=A0A818MEJ3_9BILA|nr:unnamed protein product [Rotaria socialis]CAF3588904.1 unnamed protein product [Rotaria socialis]
MDNFGPDEIQVLPDKTPTPASPTTTNDQSSDLPTYIIRPKRSNQVNNESGYTDEIEIPLEPLLSDARFTYGYLKHIQTYKDLCNIKDKSHKKKVRDFYKNQLAFIDSLEAMLLPNADGENTGTSGVKRRDRIIKILTTASLIINIILVIIKAVGAVISNSLSIISSVVDSVVDLLSSIILMWAARQIKKKNIYKYPTGRARLEPAAIIILSVIMCAASVQVIFESVQTFADDIEYFTKPYNQTSCKKLPDLDMSIVPIVVMVLTIVSKAVLFLLSYRIDNPTMSALAEDNRNDVASNIVALVCGLIGQVRHLTGVTAEPSFLQLITHLAYNFRPDAVTKIDTVRAFHSGTKFLVEVDIGLPSSMPLAIAHDIGEQLQKEIEKLDNVERAFVHLDFEFTHGPTDEHKTG